MLILCIFSGVLIGSIGIYCITLGESYSIIGGAIIVFLSIFLIFVPGFVILNEGQICEYYKNGETYIITKPGYYVTNPFRTHMVYWNEEITLKDQAFSEKKPKPWFFFNILKWSEK